MLIDLVQQNLKRNSVLTAMNFFAGLNVDIARLDVGFTTTRRLTTAVPEIIVCGVRSDFLQICQNTVGILHREIPQQAAVVFPKFEVGNLDQVFYQRAGRLAPK